MIKKICKLLVISVLATFFSCKNGNEWKNKELTILTFETDSCTFEKAIFQEFVKNFNLKFKFVNAKNFSSAIKKLQNGKAQMLLRLTPTTSVLKEKVLFTQPIAKANLVLIQNKKNELIRNTLELSGEEISIEKNSPYLLRLNHLEEELGVDLKLKEVDISQEKLIEKVAKKEIRFTVENEFSLHLLPKKFKEIDTRTVVGMPNLYAFAVSNSCPELVSEFDEWFKNFKTSEIYFELLKKFYK